MHVYFPLSILWTSIYFLRLNLRSMHKIQFMDHSRFIKFSFLSGQISPSIDLCDSHGHASWYCCCYCYCHSYCYWPRDSWGHHSMHILLSHTSCKCPATSCHKIWDIFLSASAWESSRLNRCSTCTPGNDTGNDTELLLTVANFNQWYMRTNRNVCLPFFSLFSMDHS